MLMFIEQFIIDLTIHSLSGKHPEDMEEEEYKQYRKVVIMAKKKKFN